MFGPMALSRSHRVPHPFLKDRTVPRQKDAAQMTRIPLTIRIKAWWEGYDLSRLPKVRNEGTAEEGHQPTGPRIWSADRREIAERVWGEGFLTPGGETYLPILIKPFGMNETMSVLDVGCGLGGSTRMMVNQYGAWVTGLESHASLREEGQKRSDAVGLTKKAEILAFDKENTVIDKRYDAILMKDMLFAVQNKDGLLAALVNACKPRASLLVTDYVLAHSASVGQAVQSWKRLEPERPTILTAGEEASLLAKHGFDLRIREDITETYIKLILGAWDAFSHMMPKGRPDSDTEQAIFEEAELWLRRIAAMKTGDLRVYRYFALAPGEKI